MNSTKVFSIVLLSLLGVLALALWCCDVWNRPDPIELDIDASVWTAKKVQDDVVAFKVSESGDWDIGMDVLYSGDNSECTDWNEHFFIVVCYNGVPVVPHHKNLEWDNIKALVVEDHGDMGKTDDGSVNWVYRHCGTYWLEITKEYKITIYHLSVTEREQYAKFMRCGAEYIDEPESVHMNKVIISWR